MSGQHAPPDVAALVTLLDHGSILKRLPRTGWLLNGVLPCESVADHTAGVALLTLALAGAINADWRSAGLDAALDVGRAVTLAVLHDLAESVVTDLPRRSAELIGAETKHRAEAEAMAGLLAKLPGGHDYTILWNEYDARSSPEARLVADADKLEMVHQALQYERAGHRTLDEFWQSYRWNYGLCEHLYEVLHRQRS